MASTSTQQKILYCFVIAVVIALLVATALAYLRSRGERIAPLKSMDTWQHADAPLGFPVNGQYTASFDPRFLQLSAFERNLIPTSPRMEYPMGTRVGGLTYNAQPYWADNKKRGGRHTGDDFNGIGGMNTDLGDPVFAITNSLVVYRGEPSPDWGNTLILAHRSAEGAIHQYMYSHLHESLADPGELIARGEKIGTVGTANLNYPAHLHLELRNSTGVCIGRGYVSKAAEHLNPKLDESIFPDHSPDSLYPAPLLVTKSQHLKKAREELMMNNNFH